jgi:hypothetical protein
MKPWRMCKRQVLLTSRQPRLALLPPPHATTVGTVIGTAAIAPKVMIEQANVAMMKLTGVLKSKEKKA